jgi:hypothetical protein
VDFTGSDSHLPTELSLDGTQKAEGSGWRRSQPLGTSGVHPVVFNLFVSDPYCLLLLGGPVRSTHCQETVLRCGCELSNTDVIK